MRNKLSVSSPATPEQLDSTISSHYFNETIMLASRGKEYEEIEYFWYKISCDLAYFISAEFIRILDKYAIYACSHRTSVLDLDDSIIIADGFLILNVIKSVYYSMGLLGIASKLNTNRYIIKINMKRKGFLKSKLYHRLSWCFSNTFVEKYDFSIVCMDTITNCSINIDFPSTVRSEKVRTEFLKTELIEPIHYPVFEAQKDKLFLLDCFEWIGMLAVKSPRIKVNSIVDPYFSTYSNCEPNEIVSNLKIWKAEGFFAPGFIKKLHSNHFDILIVKGFQDQPIGFNLHESSGITLYCIANTKSYPILYTAIEFFNDQ